MDEAITPRPGYHKTRMRGLWARKNCPDCWGGGEYIVTDDDDPELRYPQPCDCLWSPPPETTRGLDDLRRAQQEWERSRQQAWAYIDEAIGPRRPGFRYWCGYWGTGYTVESITLRFRDGDLADPAWSITVRWDDGHRTTHFTPWDPDHDRVEPPVWPPGPAPLPPELQPPVFPGEHPKPRPSNKN